MRPEDFMQIDPALQKRLSSWREMDVLDHPPEHKGESSVNIEEVRTRQRRIAMMCLNTVKTHDDFVAALKAYVGQGGRDPSHQQRVEDEASFALGVFEQTTAICLETGINIELEKKNLPEKEIIQTVYVQPPTPPKSWLQRVLGI